MKTAKAQASIYLDELRVKKNGKCAVKIRITYNRQRSYFPTGIDLTPEEFEQVMHGQRRTADQREALLKLNHLFGKAETLIDKLPVFTFSTFEENYLEQRNTLNSVSFAFDKYIEQLIGEKRIGTAVTYKCARNSIAEFRKNLTFAEVTPELLKKYESKMLKEGNSISTVGIYLRSFRAIYNQQGIDKSLYPFGEQKNKYSIPTSRNIKKALTLEEIGKIYHYAAPTGSTKEMAKDYWLFLYLCNGMNVKDFCLLKWSNIDGANAYLQKSQNRAKQKRKQAYFCCIEARNAGNNKEVGPAFRFKRSIYFPAPQDRLER